MRRLILGLLSLSLSFCTLLPAATPEEAMTAWKSGDYATAIPLLRSVPTTPETGEPIRAALLSAFVYLGQVDDATEMANGLSIDYPNSAASLAARGEFYFYMADTVQAEKLFTAALKANEGNARAHYGLARLLRAAAFHRSARIHILRAHAIDPQDSLITLSFLSYVVPEKRRQMAGPFFAAHPWFATQYGGDLSRGGVSEQAQVAEKEVREALTEHHAFEPVNGIQPADVPLHVLMNSGTSARGIGIDVAIGEGKALHFLLDTGASGILLSSSAAARAGLKPLGSTVSWGIGDKGLQKTSFSVADSCSIGSIQYKFCVFRTLEAKGRISGEEDGLVGTDFFDKYLIHIDFQKHQMHLTPQPERPPVPQGYDRQIPEGEKDWTPVFRFGHQLCMPTLVNRKATGLFLLDTGASISVMDSTFARLSTKIHSDSYMRVRGVSGSVKDVFSADKAELTFARFRQNNLGLTAVNLGSPQNVHQEFRLSGILGLPVLAMFRLDLDYRNNLVNFDYIGR